MSKTGLAFYRKSQSLQDMQSERPKSLDEVRRAILKATADVEQKVTLHENLFYNGRQVEDELREIVPHIREVMTTCQVTYIHAAYQIAEIMDKGNDPDELFKADQKSFAVLKDYHRKLMEFIPGRLQVLVDSVQTITDHLNRYCLSFHKGKTGDSYLETAEHYEKKRAEFDAAIKMHISNIPRMGRLYREIFGLPVKVFGLNTNELARRCDCCDLPLLLVFPEACHNIRNACKGIRKWVSEDEQYARFIQLDMNSLEQDRVAQMKLLRETHEKTFQLEHKYRAVCKEIQELEADLEKLQHRDKQLNDEVSRLEEDIKFMQIDIELKEQERQNLRERPDAGADNFEKIASRISELRHKIPAAKKQIEATKERMAFLLQRQRQLGNDRRTAEELKREIGKSKSESAKVSKEMERIERCLNVLKEIHLRKTVQDVPKKIFHDMPVHTRRRTTVPKNASKATKKAKPRPRRDTLDKAAQVVANKIEGDWPELYRKLPFYPPRGEKILDGDVDHVTQEQYRHDNKVKATDSLQRWRRMHTRANLNDLKGTLKSIARADIVEEIDESMKPKVKVKPKARRRWRRYNHLKIAMGNFMTGQTNVGLAFPSISQNTRGGGEATNTLLAPSKSQDSNVVAKRWGMGMSLPKLVRTQMGSKFAAGNSGGISSFPNTSAVTG